MDDLFEKFKEHVNAMNDSEMLESIHDAEEHTSDYSVYIYNEN